MQPPDDDGMLYIWNVAWFLAVVIMDDTSELYMQD